MSKYGILINNLIMFIKVVLPKYRISFEKDSQNLQEYNK